MKSVSMSSTTAPIAMPAPVANVFPFFMYMLQIVLQLIWSFRRHWVDLDGYANKCFTPPYNWSARWISHAPLCQSISITWFAPLITAAIIPFIFRWSLFMEELLKSARIRYYNGSVFALGFPQNQLVTSVQRVIWGKTKSIGRRITSPFE